MFNNLYHLHLSVFDVRALLGNLIALVEVEVLEKVVIKSLES